MTYIFETKLRENNSLQTSLTTILGINHYLSSNLCKKLGFTSRLKVKDLTNDQITSLVNLVSFNNIKINSELIREKTYILNKSVSIKSYKGLRRLIKLPVRGQRTHTNSKTCKKIT